MTVSVLIPFAGTDEHRLRALQTVEQQYRELGWEVIIDGVDGVWCKAASVAACLERATGGILVVADADCLCVGVSDAVAAVEGGAAWSMPHRRVHRLTEQATIDGNLAGPTTERPYLGKFGGGIVALPHTTYRQIPLDPRFTGWGQEDESWGLALDCLAGPCARFEYPLHHLWHPPAERNNRRVGSKDSHRLHARYVHARRDPDEMRALIAEFSPARAG